MPTIELMIEASPQLLVRTLYLSLFDELAACSAYLVDLGILSGVCESQEGNEVEDGEFDASERIMQVSVVQKGEDDFRPFLRDANITTRVVKGPLLRCTRDLYARDDLQFSLLVFECGH